MKFVRFVIPAALTLLATSVVAPNMAVAQGYGNAPRDSRDGRNNGNDLQGNGNAPIMAARTWHTVERAGDTWDGLWTFNDSRHRTISAAWVDRETGARISAPRMIVRQRGQQIVITRPGTGDYVGTLSADGTSLRGTMSWVQGNFTARIPRQ
jgi:hypothetical protein